MLDLGLWLIWIYLANARPHRHFKIGISLRGWRWSFRISILRNHVWNIFLSILLNCKRRIYRRLKLSQNLLRRQNMRPQLPMRTSDKLVRGFLQWIILDAMATNINSMRLTFMVVVEYLFLFNFGHWLVLHISLNVRIEHLLTICHGKLLTVLQSLSQKPVLAWSPRSLLLDIQRPRITKCWRDHSTITEFAKVHRKLVLTRWII